MAFYNYGQPNYGGVAYPTYQPNYQQPMQPTQQMQPQQQVQQSSVAPKTNKIFVTSLEEAMNRSVEPNSVIIYLHQDLPLLFEISTDFFGKKTYKTFDISESVQKPPVNVQDGSPIDLSVYVTKDDYKAVEQRLERIEAILNGVKPSTKKNVKEVEDKE